MKRIQPDIGDCLLDKDDDDGYMENVRVLEASVVYSGEVLLFLLPLQFLLLAALRVEYDSRVDSDQPIMHTPRLEVSVLGDSQRLML